MSRYLIKKIEAKDGIGVRVSSQIDALNGETALEAAEVLDMVTGKGSPGPFATVFVMIGADAVAG